ncbi:ribosomal L7Ae/L30e/S12e/Gadd45 family protein [Candidatus Woesearchaeota archaeon]|nr:ribosomal L7Ae/L30e/S12e/Gadd45 family protein [Candidatus Woesearchaeota archaeon]
MQLERGNFSLFFLPFYFHLELGRSIKMAEVSKEIIDKVLEAIEVAKATGKIKKGTNEVTKALERGSAKLVAVAKDASPPEIVMHIPLLAEEKGVVCVTVGSKEELGASTGIAVPTASAAVVAEGEAKALIKEIVEKVGVKAKEEKAEAKPAEAKPEEKPAKKEAAETPKEAPKEEKKEEAKEEKKEAK